MARKTPKGTSIDTDMARERRITNHLQTVDRSQSPPAYAMRTYDANFFLEEEDTQFKVALAKALDAKFPNTNQLWVYISRCDPRVAHLL